MWRRCLERHSGPGCSCSTVSYAAAGGGACIWVSLRANASRDFGLLNVARSERYEWRRRAQAFCIVMQAAPAARRITAWASQPVRVHRDRSRHTRGLRLLPAVTYRLRVQTGGREAQERPMTACIDNSRAGRLALGSSLRQPGSRRGQVGRRAGKVWRVLGGGNARVSPPSGRCNGS